jgi:hypothetical protein
MEKTNMAISYRMQHTSKARDGFSQILKEAQEVFAGERIQMLGGGIAEILSEDVLFSTYKDELLKGLDADTAMVMEQLIDNTRTHCLSESALSGIQPITALTMPTLRKSWPRIGVTEAIPTEAVKLPKFSLSYLTPYLVDEAGVHQPLPQALRTQAGASGLVNRKVVSGLILAADFPSYDIPAKQLPVPLVPFIKNNESLDRDFYITEVTMTGANKVGGVEKPFKVSIKMETTNAQLYGEVTKDGITDVLFGHVNRGTGELNLASVKGLIESVSYLGYIASEMNTRTEQVGFDVNLKNIDIPTGAHITAPLPIEWLQDTMAMYQIDGAMKVIDIMSDTLAQKIDMEGIAFLQSSYDENVMAGVNYSYVFDAKPPAGFTGSPKEWRDEFRTTLDYCAIKMKNDTAMTQGKFSILGNDLDTQIIPNVEWIFNNNVDERGGVDVNYSIGAYSGSNRYTLVSTPNVTQGSIYVMYIPTNQDQMTFKYYPYAFAVERANGYLDPKNPSVPSVIMTRRQVFEKFTNLIAKIDIINNTSPMSAQANRVPPAV